MAECKSTPKRARPCPLCKKMSVESYFPFCSKRCADVDLNRWLGGVYAIPTKEKPAPGQDEENDAGS